MSDKTLQVVAVETDRWRRMAGELQDAIGKTDRDALLAWSVDAAKMTLHAGERRVRNFGRLLMGVGDWFYDGTKDAFEAGRDGRLIDHATERAERNWNEGTAFFKHTIEKAKTFGELASNRERLPQTVVMIVAALVSSGGIDGDGGIPDLDLTFGIDAHRSIFSHSIISGTVVEGAVYAVATLVGLVHAKLPDQHDEYWDVIERNRVGYLEHVSKGVCAGIAYHLLVDGIVQPTAYHDLPVSAPLEVHEAVIIVNGVAEAIDVGHKAKTFKSTE